jgi:hypothetical protein
MVTQSLLPPCFAHLVQTLAECFTRPTFVSFQVLLVGLGALSSTTYGHGSCGPRARWGQSTTAAFIVSSVRRPGRPMLSGRLWSAWWSSCLPPSNGSCSRSTTYRQTHQRGLDAPRSFAFDPGQARLSLGPCVGGPGHRGPCAPVGQMLRSAGDGASLPRQEDLRPLRPAVPQEDRTGRPDGGRDCGVAP